jgi:hypothetical protein
MSEHEPCVGATDEWYTPPEIFAGLNCRFDLDPCQPNEGRAFLSVPCDQFFTEAEDGLAQEWRGLVWMNPPFGGRNGVLPWLRKFFNHRNGIGLVAARTSAGWFHDQMPRADALLFPRGKTKFVRPDGSVGKSPGTGVVLFSSGPMALGILRDSGLGMFVRAA